MSGVRTKRLAWTILFLGVTLVAIGAEVVAGVWHPAGTIPWTEYIAQYVPWPVQLAAYVVLAVWLPFHFLRADQKRKAAYRRGVTDGRRSPSEPSLGLATTQQMLAELRARGQAEMYYEELGAELAMGAQNLIEKMPGSMLEYRTVDGD